jgi:hypothetical protein
MRRLIQVCASEPHNAAAVRAALQLVSLRELPPLAVCSGTTGRELATGTFAALLRDIQHVTTLELFANSAVSVTLFALPPCACLPMHDHPGMTVVHRLLLGRLHHLSVDWADGAPAINAPTQPRKGRITECGWAVGEDPTAATAGAAEPPATHTIDADGGGVLHSFTAGDDGPAVFIDVISPPYHSRDPATGRPLECTFFDVHHAAGGGDSPRGDDPAHHRQRIPAHGGCYAESHFRMGDGVTLVPCAGSASPHMDFFSRPRGSPSRSQSATSSGSDTAA